MQDDNFELHDLKAKKEKLSREAILLNLRSHIEKGEVDDVIEFFQQPQNKDIDVKDDDFGRTALHWAEIFNQSRIVIFLTDQKANPHVKDNFGDTPRLFAASQGRVEQVIHADWIGALRNGDAKMVKDFADSGAVIIQADKDKGLFIAAADTQKGNSRRFIKVLAARRQANVNVVREDGSTPLHLALITNNLDALKYLLRYGANPNVKMLGDMTPLDFAFMNKNVEAIKLLVKNGADLLRR